MVRTGSDPIAEKKCIVLHLFIIPIGKPGYFLNAVERMHQIKIYPSLVLIFNGNFKSIKRQVGIFLIDHAQPVLIFVDETVGPEPCQINNPVFVVRQYIAFINRIEMFNQFLLLIVAKAVNDIIERIYPFGAVNVLYLSPLQIQYPGASFLHHNLLKRCWRILLFHVSYLENY